jgi:hypothetical protein
VIEEIPLNVHPIDMTAQHDVSEKVIPIMPCPDIKTLVPFYEALGFEVAGLYTSPNPYAALRWRNIEMHFWGSRKVVPADNSTICFLLVNDLDKVHQSFTDGLKKLYGKIPRTGFPKITKVRNLVDDRRFTLTDPGGNTLYIGAKATSADRFFRTLNNQQYAKNFAALYDVLYSREDPHLANSMLPKYAPMGSDLQGLDKAKFLLLLADIQKHLYITVTDNALIALINEQPENNEDWKRIKEKYAEILNGEY